MLSTLSRWLHKRDPLTSPNAHPSGHQEAQERPDPPVVPTIYVCEELAHEFAKYWRKIRHDDGEEKLDESQLNALARWHAFPFPLGKSTQHHPLPLDFFFDIFDDYFFLGSLRPYTAVEYVDRMPHPGLRGLCTTYKHRMPSGGPPETRIRILRRKDSAPVWSAEVVGGYLGTLLHELAHAFLDIHTLDRSPVEVVRFRRQAETDGMTGHGPCWIEVAKAVQEEADRSFGGVQAGWDLNIKRARVNEKRAVGKWRDRRELALMNGLTT